MKIDGRLAVSLMMLLIFLFFVDQALAFRPEARTMPLLIGVPAILLCLLQIALDLKDRSHETAKAVVAFGFTYGAPPLVAAYLYFASRERLGVVIAGGAFCVLMLSFVFDYLLKVQLFEGLITPLLF